MRARWEWAICESPIRKAERPQGLQSNSRSPKPYPIL